DEVGRFLDSAQHPDSSSAMRAALIREFKTCTRVLVATEAGAKGLNLQFCNCLVNFDLPWNPQRIEQRIGRVHRYGQPHDVVIVNFINQDNEGEVRVYELLKEKLHLFEGLFGASDAILGQVVSTLNFERRIEDLFVTCRTAQERQQEFDRIELELDEQQRKLRDARLSRARNLISALDEDVQARLKLQAEALPVALSRRDENLLALLEARSPIAERRQVGERVIFEWEGRRFHLGPPRPGEELGQPLSLDHPRVQGLIEEARLATDQRLFRLSAPTSGRWCAYRVVLTGLEVEERILVLGPEGRAGLEAALAQATDARAEGTAWEDPSDLPEVLERMREDAERAQEPRLHRLLDQLRAREQDTRRYLDQRQAELQARLAEAERKERFAKDSEQARHAQATVSRLRRELDELRAGREDRLFEVTQALSDRRFELYQQGSVQAEAVRLFAVEAGS
ncbi:MAG: helicase-related protein, partial [Candidatus Eremiobacterota bacterium]